MESRLAEATITSTPELTEQEIKDLKTILRNARERAVESAKAADRVVRGHPYQAIGVALGVGLLIGLLVGRRAR